METLYTRMSYPTKKSIKEALAAGSPVQVYSASVFSNGKAPDGKHTLCGPSESVRKYYAEIEVKDGCIVKMK